MRNLHTKTSVAFIVSIFAVIFTVVFRFFYTLTYQTGVSFNNISSEVFAPPTIGGILACDIYGVIFVTMLVSIFFTGLIIALLNKSQAREFLSRQLYRAVVFPAFLIIFLIIIAIQAMIGERYAYKEKIDFSDKTLEQKKEMIFQFSYEFARTVKQKLPGAYVAEIVSDLDFGRKAEMTLHRQLCYFLYPINVRSHPQTGTPDVLLFIGKKKAVEFIPSEYEINYQYDDENLVAVRKGIRP